MSYDSDSDIGKRIAAEFAIKPDNRNNCYKCGSPGHKTDGNGRLICRGCLGLPDQQKSPPIRKPNWVQGRNDLCACHSGLKYKKCCLINE